MTYAEWVEREMAAARRVRTEVNRAPRAERERAAADFFRAMKTSPRLVGDRVRWLLLESYGLGPARWANAVLEEADYVVTPDVALRLLQLVSLFEWRSPEDLTAKAWQRLSPEERGALIDAIDRAISAIIEA
jgi:hypothetical protein